MTQSNNDIEELEELLTELEGQEARLVAAPYSEDDDAVTQLMDAPLGDQEWMVQVTALDRRMMSTDQLSAELRAGRLGNRTLVWRGGMDDWLPIARVDALAQGVPAPGLGRLGAPAPLPAPPAWSTLPSAAPLPPPPAALPPASPLSARLSSSAMSSSPMGSVGLPPLAAAPGLSSETGVQRPVAATPSSGNTTRPVAIDFSDRVEDTSSPLRGKRAVIALGAVAILAVFLSFYALSSKSEATASADTPSAEQPRAVSALQPAANDKQPEPAMAAAAKPAESAADPSKATDSEPAANEAAASSGSSARTTAPARYSPRSEYRRRSRGSAAAERASEETESGFESAAAEVPARAAAPSRATAAADEEAPPAEAAAPAGSPADDADAPEAPKSTSRAGNTFNREAARTALNQAAAQAKNCRPAGGPSGPGRVEVRYEPSGKVSNVTLLTGKFDNTTTGDCVRMLFRRAKVPEFTGAPVMTVNKSFEIP